MRAILVLLLDGLGDRGYSVFGGRTSNEAARTPHLDALAARASCGLLSPLGPGRAPSSELAHWAILGYRADEFPGRAVFEALGHGQHVDGGDVLAYAALRPARRRDGALWLTGRPSEGDEPDARVLTAAVERIETGALTFSLAYIRRGESILRVSGGGHDAVTDSDAFFRDRQPVLRPSAVMPEAEATARAARAWSRIVVRTLDAHPVNAARASRAAPPLNVVTLKWWGRMREAPSLLDRHGLEGAIVGASPFLAGLATVLGLRFVACEEGGDPAGDLERRLDLAARLLADGATFVLVHEKATDEAGHTKDARARRATIEALDAPLARLEDAAFSDAVVALTGDHATPAVPEVIHSGDPVPFLLTGPGVRGDRVARFGEADCAEGILGHLRGEDVMPVLLNAADRALFLGSRPTPVPAAAGFPARVAALEA